MHYHFFKKENRGFAMLFTVLIVTLILSIAMGISNITFKQTILSSLAKDSEIALYQADAGIECALYYDLNVNKQSFNGVNSVPASLTCGNQTLNGGQPNGSSSYYQYTATPSGGVCINSIVIDKTGTQNGVPVVKITARGNNICQSNPRQVERALQVQYAQ